MLQSMTGFARVTGLFGAGQWVWELKSVNARGLDVRVRVPTGLDLIGEEARKLLLASFARGTINANLSIGGETDTQQPRINAAALEALLASLAGVTFPPDMRPASVDGFLAVRGIVEVAEGVAPSVETLRPHLVEGLQRAVNVLREARRAEGAALGSVLQGQCDTIARLTNAADSHPARTPEAIKARLAEQVASLIAAYQGLDHNRLHQEAAILAVKADIREELDRLNAHIGALRDLLTSGGSVGRKLDFLAQEFGREASTLCAKAGDVTLSRIGLELRTVVDQLREQVQNVE